MMHRTMDQIRRDGLAALRAKLGRFDMIRFMQQFETGSGDYARERHDWVDRQSMSDLRALSRKRHRKTGAPKRKSRR